MQNLLALIQQASAGLKKLIAFLSKEFFLLFVYVVIGSLLTGLFWLLLVYVFPNKEIYTQLCNELNGSKQLVIGFLFAASFACIYLYRLLLAAVLGAVLKQGGS
jgi:type II secretory pathway component PulF